ncbi:helix-turn-helix domain-containing protein [Candidatus Clostridium stratigraminis]|uniref:Helix-turn-helix domain-containing protein n=1 Tax=Candidatus Clostridium stratigraminis TaxID=3381661 RepID=A0ABW8SZF5_9CLOT
MTILGDNIKQLRELAGMSVRDLADKSSVAQSTISEIETGKNKNPRSDTLGKIAKALNSSVEQLTDMVIEQEYAITDVEEAMKIILNQEKLMLHGEILTDESKLQLANSIKMALRFVEEIQKTKK